MRLLPTYVKRMEKHILLSLNPTYWWWFRNPKRPPRDVLPTLKIMGHQNHINWWSPDFFQQHSSLTYCYCWWTKSCTSWGWWFIPLFDKGFIHPNGGSPWDFFHPSTVMFLAFFHLKKPRHPPSSTSLEEAAHLDRRLGGSVPFAVLLHQDLAEMWWGVPVAKMKKRGDLYRLNMDSM